YLFSEEQIRAAKQSGADAIHPGYGFLAESGDFAEAVEAAGLAFVGPTPEALRAGGDKLESKRIAAEAGVPVVPTGEPDEVGSTPKTRRPSSRRAGGSSGCGCRSRSASMPASRRATRSAWATTR